ncbi:MAG: DNA repair protein RecO [Pseudomonadota bacterium]
MEWRDEGIILSVRPHGETAAIVEVLTRAHGRHLGLVHGGRSRRMRPTLQVGNHVSVAWRARITESLGVFSVELFRPFASEVLHDPKALAAVSAIAELTRVLPERDPHAELFEITHFVFGFLAEAEVWPALYVRWELALLDELGHGLDLSKCVATGATNDLVYVSPRSGQAVSRDAGVPYAEKLFKLPSFLRRQDIEARIAATDASAAVDAAASAEPTSGMPQSDEIRAALEMTGHFLARRVFGPIDRELPEPRGRLLRLLSR